MASQLITTAQTFGAYLSFDGEIDTLPLIQRLWQQKKTVALPLLHPFSQGHLLFQRYQPNTEIRKNQHGTREPKRDLSEIVPHDKLDILFIPLVAFDMQGQRLGMGGGFYDRTLKNWQHYPGMPIGLAHDCQLLHSLPVAAWDIPLPIIFTPAMSLSNLKD